MTSYPLRIIAFVVPNMWKPHGLKSRSNNERMGPNTCLINTPKGPKLGYSEKKNGCHNFLC